MESKGEGEREGKRRERVGGGVNRYRYIDRDKERQN